MSETSLRSVAVPPPRPPARALPGGARWGWTAAAGALHTRGVAAEALVAFALAFAATAAFVFLVDHPGIGGILGLLALLAAELSLVPPRPERAEASGLVRGLNPLVDLLLAAGVVAGLAPRQGTAVLVLAFLVFVLLAWLPLLKAVAGPGRVPTPAALWHRGERTAILLLGASLGRLVVALLAIAVIGALDAWLRLERLDQPAGLQRRLGSDVARYVLTPDGSFVPAVRWGTLLVTLALLLVLPKSAAWRF